MPPNDGDEAEPVVDPVTGQTSVIDPVTGKPATNFFTLDERPADQAEAPSAPALGAAPTANGPNSQHTVSSLAGQLENPNWWVLPDIVSLAGTVNPGTLGSIAGEWAQLGAGFDDLTNELTMALRAAVAEAWSGPAANAAVAAINAFTEGAIGTTFDFRDMYNALSGASYSAQSFKPPAHSWGDATPASATAPDGQATAAARAAMASYYVTSNRETDSMIPQFTQPVLPAGGIPAFPDSTGTSPASSSAADATASGPGTGPNAAGTHNQPTAKDQGKQGNSTDASSQQHGDGQSSDASGLPQIPRPDGSEHQNNGSNQMRTADFDPGTADSAGGGSGVGSGLGGGNGADGEPLTSPTLGGSLAGTPASTGMRGATTGSGRTPGSFGMPGMGAAGGKKDDKEHRTARYLYGTHNGEILLADDRAVTPAVIGAEFATPPADEESDPEGEPQ